MDIIAIPSNGEGGLDDTMSPRFGRCMGFTFVTLENNEITEVKTVINEAANAMGSAGISAAQTVGTHKASVVIVGFLGPNASDALNALNLKILQISDQGLTIKQVINRYLEGGLPELAGANVAGHHGMGGGRGGGGRGMGGGGGGMRRS